MTARNRDEATDDSVLSVLDTLDYDQLWLMAVDTGDGLSPGDAAGIMRFRERGGGVLTARDHQDLGSCLVCLGSIGRLNHFHNQNPEPHARRDDQDNPDISWPNYHSGANGDYQPVFADEPAHELLRTDRNRQRPHRVVPGPPARGCGVGAADDTTSRRSSAGVAARSPAVRSTSRSASTARRRPTAAPWAGRWRARRSTTSPT